MTSIRAYGGIVPLLAWLFAGCSGVVDTVDPHGGRSTTTTTSGTSATSGTTTSSSSATSGTTTSGTGGSGGGAGSGGSSDDLQFCLDENNRYRATAGSPPLVLSATLAAFAATGAKYDYDAKSAHKHFGDSSPIPPGSNSAAENEIPGWGGWNLAAQKTVHAVIEGGLKDMWNEGPGGGHYENMKDPKNRIFGCGIYVAPNTAQDVTVTMDFAN